MSKIEKRKVIFIFCFSPTERTYCFHLNNTYNNTYNIKSMIEIISIFIIANKCLCKRQVSTNFVMKLSLKAACVYEIQ